ncbi:MAG: tetratricopeptide repeat protein [Symploca sp. SIO2B6]|nr:tetratricopeptide repeat protein [Symploca sp. SIO2B6]
MTGLSKQSNPDQPLGGRYKILSQLAAGGFGQTYLAQDLHLPGRPKCVVKQLKPQVSDPQSLQIARRLFDTEAKVLYQLGNHDQIPRLLAHLEENQEFYLAQEFIEGEPLSNEIIEGQPWSESQVIALMQDVLYVLAFVHEQNVIHRDIKPPNLIRRQQDGRIVLIDFGAVKQVSAPMNNSKTGLTSVTICIGTAGYMPQEQLAGNPRFSSDIYAVGMMAIQALTGIQPRHLGEDPHTGEIKWRELAALSGPELGDVVDLMVRYDYRERYPRAADALEALQNLPARLWSSVQQLQPLPQAATVFLGKAKPGMDQTVKQPLTDSEAELAYTQPIGSKRATQHSSESVAPTPAPSLTKKRLLIPGLVIASLAAMGGSFFTARTFQANQSTGQNTSESGVVSEIRTANIHQNTSDESAKPSNNNSESESTTNHSPQRSVLPSAVSKDNSEQSSPAPKALPSPTNISKASSAPTPTSPKPPAPAPTVEQSPAPIPTAPTSVTSASTSSPPSADSPTQPTATELLEKARSKREKDKNFEAVKLYEQVIAIDSQLAEAHWGRCYSLNKLQQPQEAIASCNQALAINSSYAEALWSKGNSLDQQKRYSDAIMLYEQAIEIKPDFAEAWNNKGVSLYMLESPRVPEAIEAYKRAITLQPDFSNAWSNLGAALWSQGRFQEARAAVDKALDIDPNNKDAKSLRKQMH